MDLISTLSSFSTWKRLSALDLIAASTTDFPPESQDVNMHIHTFFSYNGEGWSPSRIAYEMKKLGLYAAAICDFDVLSGLDEFLRAADMLRLRAAVSMESRVFFPEYADKEINSPGEPGVFYFMGTGFAHQPTPGTEAESIFMEMMKQFHNRNRALIERINSKLNGFAIDYDKDVLPLTPMRNATERHIVRAYYDQAIAKFGSYNGAADFWSEIFKQEKSEMRANITDLNRFNEFLRSKLMKKGGLGYVQPNEGTFPKINLVIKMIRGTRAMPTAAWLDGSLPGEADPQAQLECLRAKGVEAVNIIPDRNWNFKDPAVKAEKVKKLNEYIAVAKSMDLPIMVGTECNKPGQRLVDDFKADALQPYISDFIEGANVIVGQTRLLRFANLSYVDSKNDDMFKSKAEKNQFYAKVGALPAPDHETMINLFESEAEHNLDYIQDCVKYSKWI